MAEVEIAIGKSKYHIQCQESEKDKLLNAANKLNEIVNMLSFSFRDIDEKTLLVMAGLTVLEESEQQVENPTQNSDQDLNKSAITERDVYEAVSENMENISDYVEKLTKKIRSY